MERLQQQRTALGTDAVYTIIGNSTAEIERQFRHLWQRTELFEQQLSRFLETSELTRFNQEAGTKFRCTEEFRRTLITAKYWSEQTNGLFNPFVLPLLVAAGYATSMKSSQPAPTFANAIRVPTINELEIGSDWARIPADSAIDLGGIGKGYLLDLLATEIEKTVDSYWLSLGGDIVGRGTNLDNKPWQMAIENAKVPGEPTTNVAMPGAGRWAIATSGTNRRKGERWHHIINPTTGQSSVSDVITASVVTISAVAADVLASVVVIAGVSEGEALLESCKVDSSFIQKTDGTFAMRSGMVQWKKGMQ